MSFMLRMRKHFGDCVTLLAQSTDGVQENLQDTMYRAAVFEADERAAGRPEEDIQNSGVVDVCVSTFEVCTNPAAENVRG